MMSVADALTRLREGNRRPTLQEAVAANVRNTVRELRQGSETLGGLIDGDNLSVIGAEYSIESGRVEFFDD